MRRTRTITRHLKAGEPLPAGEPTMRSISTHGYVVVAWVVANQQQVRTYEHRYVMGNPLGVVHHKNGIQTDNRPENLEVMTPSEHARHHHAVELDAGRVVELYRSGWSARRLARTFSVAQESVRAVLASAGVARRGRGNLPKLNEVQVSMVLERLRRGDKQRAIAKDFGVHQGTISHIACEACDRQRERREAEQKDVA